MVRRSLLLSSLGKLLLSVGSSFVLLLNSTAAVYAASPNPNTPPMKLVPPPEARPVDDPGLVPEFAQTDTAPKAAPVETGGRKESQTEPASPEKSSGTQGKPRVFKGSVSAPYLLGPGDELTIVDPTMGTEEDPYKTDVRIAPDGTVSVPPVGSVMADGLTISELTDLLNDREKKFVDSPSMTVILRKERVVYVHVLGEVVNPGLYSDKGVEVSGLSAASGTSTTLAGGQQSVLQVGLAATLSAAERQPGVSGLTILTALQLAGGVKDTADIRHVRLVKYGDSDQKSIDLWRLLVEGDNTLDVPLRSGDSIFVPKGGAPFDSRALGWVVRKPRPVRILGEVNRPGLYYLGPDDDLITILAKAGGFDSIARQRAVILSRQNHDGTVTTRAVNVKAALRNHDKAGRLAVMPGDVIIVNASVMRRLQPLITYMVAISGTFALLNVINASIPTTFLANLNRSPTGGNSSAGFALFGLGAALPFLSGYGVRQQSAPPQTP